MARPTPALDRLEDMTHGLTDDREISLRVSLLHDALAEVGQLVDRLEWAENFVPQELRG